MAVETMEKTEAYTKDTLVVHTGGIGDFLLSCPALAQIARPGNLDLLGRRDRLTLAVAGGLARQAYDLDTADFHTVFDSPSPRLRAFMQRYKKVVVWMRDTGEIARGLAQCCVLEVNCFPGLPPQDWARHASEYYLDCLGLLPATTLRLEFPQVEEVYDVIIHPGSGGVYKNWPLEYYLAVAEALDAAGRHVAWCLGPAEADISLPVSARRLRFDSLTHLASVLQNAALYLGNDSGITHLAAAASCRVVAIFGPTDPVIWAPKGDHVQVIQGQPWPEPQQVIANILA